MAQRSTGELVLVRRLGLGAALAATLGTSLYYLWHHFVAQRRPAATHPQPTLKLSAQPVVVGPGLRLGRILIPVANPATASGLVRMASALGAGQPPAELIALKVVAPPKGVPLEEVRRYVLAMRSAYEGALSQATSYAEREGIALRGELEVAPGVGAGILGFAESLEDLDLILMGWRGTASLRRARRGVDQQIVSRARTAVAVLRDRELDAIRRILVPVGWGPHARLGLRLAERLARNTGAAVTALRVLPAIGEVDWEAERAALVQLLAVEAPGLRYDTELRLVREPAAAPAILAEAQRVPYDLLIIGASDEWWLRKWLFGVIPDQVAEQAPCSVLLVRRYEPAEPPQG